ncbi:hypothetical protein [Trichloromonas sp.]|jgi:hypothetical protein|uniref:hypothetical protein n=1 Tax=Trichloromonas sp. TaxID=3069249 RepID=UPI002A44E01A|nr:hypothetical protein [Trichloromonas sp.]
MSKFLKLTLKVQLISNSKVRFEVLYVCPEIHSAQYAILFQSRKGYVIEKFSHFKYKVGRLLLPYKIERTRQYVDIIDFKNDNIRYNMLKRLSEDLREFSRCDIFNDMDKSSFLTYKLKMDKDFWFLY